MGYFNYHAKVKKDISESGLSKVELLSAYNKISPCMLIYCKSGNRFPIREHRWCEYFDIFETQNENIIIIDNREVK